MEEVASIADAGEHGTRVEAASTGACSQYPSKPPRRLTGVISALGHNRPPAPPRSSAIGIDFCESCQRDVPNSP
jgi:hypothetical protein